MDGIEPKSRRALEFVVPRFKLTIACALILCAGCSLATGMAGRGGRKDPTVISNSREPRIPAPGPDLKGKRVVLLTTISASVAPEFRSLDRPLNEQVIALLKHKNIDVIDSGRIFGWIDQNPHWADPEEIAKAFVADIVIVLELESFRTNDPESPSNLYGYAKTHVSATETIYPVYRNKRMAMKMPEETKLVYDDRCETTFPVRGPIAETAGVTPEIFKRRFLQIVSAELSWRFVEHSPEEDIQDVKFKDR